MGRYKQPTLARRASEGISIQAKDDAGRPWTATVTATRGEVLAPVWARGHLRDLEDHFATRRGDIADLEKKIVATSLKFGVLCRFTAFVAVDVTEVINDGGHMKRVTQPVDAAAGWDMLHPRQGETMFRAAIGMAAPGRLPSPMASAPAAPPSMESIVSIDASLTTMDFDPIESAARASKSKSSLVFSKRRRLKSADSDESAKKAMLAGPGLSAYRQRAADLLTRLEAATDRVRELGVLSVKLDELLDDLKSIGTPEAERQPLADLLTELRTFLANASPSTAEVKRMGERCREVLTTFAGTRSAKFWA